jgi:O-antigen/teichoic acid export membrane protein
MRATIARGAILFSYTPLLGLAATVSFVKLIVYAKLVTVAQFGALGQMLLVSAVFGMAASLGLQSVASRDVPALFARGLERRGVRLLVQTIAVASWIAVLGLLAAAAGLPLFDLTVEELMLGVFHGWVQLAFLTLASESRSRLDMMRYARDMAARNTAIAAAGAVFAGLGFGARGVIVAEVAGTLLFCVLVGRAVLARSRVGLRWLLRAMSLRQSRVPWRAALLMLAGALVMFVSFNVDRWIAAETLPRHAFGVYAFGWLALLAAQSVQGLLNSALLPMLSRRRAVSLEASAYRLTVLVSAALLVGGLSAVLPTAWALGRAVEHWLPQYAEARALWLPLLLAAVFRVSDFWSSLLLVIEREGLLLTAQSAAVAVACLGYAISLNAGMCGLTPVSLAWLAFAAAVLSHASSAAMVAYARSATSAT